VKDQKASSDHLKKLSKETFEKWLDRAIFALLAVVAVWVWDGFKKEVQKPVTQIEQKAEKKDGQ
jgi:hypothetical protein